MNTIVINPEDDYVLNEEDAAMFMTNVRKTQEVVSAAQKERGAKQGELVVRATMEHFWVKDKNGRSGASTVPADVDQKNKMDGTGTYNAGIPLQATIEEFGGYIPDLCEKRTDGQPGWRIKWIISYFQDAKNFLVEGTDEKPTARTLAAWTTHPVPEDDVKAYGLKEAAFQHGLTEEGYPNDALSSRIRQCVGKDGKLVTSLWTNVTHGESARFKGPDYTPKSNLLRATNASGAQVVQQSSLLIFNHVVPTIYVTFNNQEVATVETTNTGASTGGPPANKKAAVVAKKKEMYLGMTFSYECKGSVLLRENKEASDLSASEHLHYARSKDAHQLVPIQMIRSNAAQLPKTCYFYVLPRYITRWNPEHPDWWPKGSQGISLFRNPWAPYDLRNVIQPTDPKEAPIINYLLTIDLAVFQWHDRPHTNERYVVNARVRKEDDIIWRSFGISNGEAYASILLANQDIPFHCTLNFWRKATMERPANDPKEINRVEGTENIRAYYDFIIDSVTPDYFRFFARSGMRLSLKFIEREFDEWILESKKTKASTLRLNPFKQNRPNPLHARQGLSSSIISMGNGQPAPDPSIALSDDEGYYHGCSGDVTRVLSPDGRYQFYVLTSQMLTDVDRKQYCGPQGVEADAWLAEQIENASKTKTPFYYWIFALDTQAKLAKPKTAAAVELPTTPAVAVGSKRERAEETAEVPPQPTKVEYVEEVEEEVEEEEMIIE